MTALTTDAGRTAQPAVEPARRTIRVVHLLHTMAHGGVETAILNWIGASDRDRFDIRLVCFRNPGNTEAAFLRSANAAGLHVELIDWDRSKPVFRAARQLAAYLKANDIDIVHCHNTYANLVGLAAARLHKVKTLTTMYVWGDLGFKRNVLQWIDARIMKWFDQVTAHCEEAFRGTVERGIPEEDLRLLICGYPVQERSMPEEQRLQLRASLNATPDHKVLLYLARFWPEKAHDNLLHALKRIIQIDSNVQLWLPGDGPDYEATRALCTSMGLDPWVNFLGFRSDFEDLLRAADIQVHASDAEGVSLAICAGMAAGVPIVASRVGGLEEVLRHDHSAVLIPPRDPDALAAAILDLIANPSRAQALGTAAARFIREQYSVKVATERVESLYESMLTCE